MSSASQSNLIEPKLFPMFATPFMTLDLPNAVATNQELTRFFQSLVAEGAKHRNATIHNYDHETLFESNFDLFDYDNPAVQFIKRFMFDGVRWVTGRLNGFNHDQLDAVKLYADAWFHITEKTGYFVAHNHPMASWSAVYCVDDGGYPDDHPDSGVLRFHDPRPHANTYIDNANSRISGGFGCGSYNLKLRSGQLVVFPSYLIHEVAPYMGDRKRITIAANFWSDRYGDNKA